LAPQAEHFDRMVLDFKGNMLTDDTALKFPPYYQVEIDSSKRSLIVTLYGKSKLGFNTDSVKRMLGKLESIERIDFLPQADDDRWTFFVALKSKASAEVFELSEPARLIIDVKPLP